MLLVGLALVGGAGIAAESGPGDESAARTARRRRVLPPYSATTVKDGGAISGVVSYSGAVPPARKVAIVKDHATCGKHATEVPAIRVDSAGRVTDAVVFLSDISRGKAPEAPSKAARIDQSSCEFKPHVQAVVARMPVEIVNDDPVAHNIKADQGVATLFNVLQPSQGMKATRTFDRPGLVELRCNVHDWMQGFVWVLPHPYFFVTGADGAFSLSDVPPGKYTLTVWQEHLGEQSFPVEVIAGKETTTKVELQPRASR
jgi:plastocyanin